MNEELTLAEALAQVINEAIDGFEAEIDQIDVLQALTIVQFGTLFPDGDDTLVDGAGV